MGTLKLVFYVVFIFCLFKRITSNRHSLVITRRMNSRLLANAQPRLIETTSRTKNKQQSLKRATLVLEDGSSFPALSFGCEKPISGEIVFSTGMVGYAESLTDPSYTGQVQL
jgi:hypothetical protein